MIAIVISIPTTIRYPVTATTTTVMIPLLSVTGTSMTREGIREYIWSHDLERPIHNIERRTHDEAAADVGNFFLITQ